MKLVGASSVMVKFAAVAACLMAAAVMADETISADVTLSADADWRAKGVVTIAEGVTVSLNGHNLSLAGLAGAGTIDSPIADLTSPSGASSSPTTFLGGNAGNLFNNNFARSGTDNSKRIIVAKANLPLIVDYDFGAGNEKTIDMYNVYCGPMQNYQKRCPKSWTFEGSNDNQNWTVLDTRSSETGWSANNADCRTKTFENTTAYRYYRFKATAAQDNTDGYLEMVQLEYFDTSACDELHLDIPAETTVENEGVAIKGNIKLVKEGAGTFMAAKSGQTYLGGTHVVAGTFKGGSTYNVSGYAGTGPILVESGATLDINGNLYFYLNPITLAGGTVANTGTSPTINQTQLADLTLTADSYFNAQGSLGMINADHAESRIDLGGHTLFVHIGPDAVFRLDNTDVFNGTIKVVENHGIISFVNREVRSQNATFDFTGKLSCFVDSKVGDMILREEEFSAPGAPNWFRVFGKLTPLSDDFSNMEMQDGSSIDLSVRTKSLNTANPTDEYHITFVSNAVVTLNLEGRTLALGEKLISWRKKWRPAEVTFQFDVATAQSGIEPVLTDTGLFYGVDPNSTLAEYAWWTGAADDGNPANPANWTCKNAAGNIIENGLPEAITTVSVTGATDFQASADSSFVCEVFEIGDCRLTADCDWRAVARFSLDAESKIDLNGHKLYVNGLYGDGEVTGGEFDLTTDDPGRASSPMAFFGSTTAANLFNNNFSRNVDSLHRVIVETKNLPLVVDYDFGEATYVDSYAMYVGPDHCMRTPKSWNIYGSNDGAHWTPLDSRTVPLVGSSALCRRFGIATPSSYQRYRFEATAAHDVSDGFLELVQLEYGDTRATGELHVNVPEGETVRNANVLLTGKLKFVKEGAGTFIAAKAGQTYCGGTEIVAGLLQEGAYGYDAPLGNAGAVAIGPEGRFNMAMGAFFGYPFVLAGGEIGSSADFAGTSRTIPSLTLTADSLFDATRTLGLVGDTFKAEPTSTPKDANAPTVLDLGGHTLDVVIGGDGRAFRLKNTTALNGKVRVVECADGGIFSFIDTAVRAETVDFEIKGEVRVHCPTTVRNLTFDESVCTATAAVQSKRSVVYVLGTFKTAATDFPNVRMMDGSVLDLRDGQGAFAAESTSEDDFGLSFADGATVMLDLRGRRFVNGDYAITWDTPPENLASLKFKAYGRSPYTFSTDAGGVRVFSGMVISIR